MYLLTQKTYSAQQDACSKRDTQALRLWEQSIHEPQLIIQGSIDS